MEEAGVKNPSEEDRRNVDNNKQERPEKDSVGSRGAKRSQEDQGKKAGDKENRSDEIKEGWAKDTPVDRESAEGSLGGEHEFLGRAKKLGGLVVRSFTIFPKKVGEIA